MKELSEEEWELNSDWNSWVRGEKNEEKLLQEVWLSDLHTHGHSNITHNT